MRRTILYIATGLFLFSAITGADELEILRSRILKARPETVRATTETGASLPLRLFEDVQVNAILDKIEDNRFNGFVWRGHLDAVPGGWVVLVEDRGCLAGTVVTAESFYRIRCLENGLHAIDELAPPDSYGDDVAVPDWGYPDPFGPLQSHATPLGDEIVEVDILVVYTRRAAKKLFRELDTGYSTKKRAMVSQIKLAVAIANTILENSGVNIRLRLVRARPVKYKATGESSLDLRRLEGSTDGYMEKVHDWRDRYGADVVSMVLEKFESGFSGRGYQVPSDYPWLADWMFSVVSYDALWWYSLAHEVGHNMGLAHDRGNDSSQPDSRSFKYSRGYRDPEGGFLTVMSYREGCSRCRWRIPHFSNKAIRWQGAPTGNPDLPLTCGDGSNTGPRCGRKTGSNKADGARSLNKTRQVYTEIRACEVDCAD